MISNGSSSYGSQSLKQYDVRYKTFDTSKPIDFDKALDIHGNNKKLLYTILVSFIKKELP